MSDLVKDKISNIRKTNSSMTDFFTFEVKKTFTYL